jgi:predicted ATP pyrophosphatase (TIGR00289 family)
MFHHPCTELTKLQAEAIGIRHITRTTAGEKEKELEDLTTALKEISGDVDAVVSGAVASRYQKDRIDAVCKELGLRSICPLWGKDQLKLLQAEVEAGFEVIITAVAAEGFDESWLGRKLDEKCIDDLVKLNKKYGINLIFEGGEAESFVLDAPIFKKRIEIDNIKKIWDEKTGSGYIICKDAKLIDK